MTEGLQSLGLSSFFEKQISVEDLSQGKLARITEVQRSHLICSNGESLFKLSIAGSWYQRRSEERPTIGDWVILDENREKIERLLSRKSIFRRIAVGKKVDLQLIAANLDVLFIVTSCNDDFNEARIERYLSMAVDAGIKAVLIVTKADLIKDATDYRHRIAMVQPDLPIELINALNPDSLVCLEKWITSGTTVGLVGSSGVGKSTIVNLVCERHVAQTADIREQDSKGRHTTSFRSLHQSPNGGVLLDLPGMREIKVAELDTAVNEVFADINELAADCKFADCEHRDEPNCAVLAGLESGSLSSRRLASYHKLLAEEQLQTQRLADQRHRSKQLSKSVRAATKSKQIRKGRA